MKPLLAEDQRVARRTYAQYCALAKALDVLGERWTLLIVRELLLGQRRFTDLLEGLPGIGTTLLASRLKHLEGHGIIRRTRLAPPAASTVYELTERGLDLGRALLPLAMWGAHLLGPRIPGELFRLEWFLLALRAVLEKADTKGIRVTCEFHVDEHAFTVRFDDGAVDVRAGPADAPDVVVGTDLPAFLDVGLGRADPADLVGTDRMSIDGDPGALLELLRVLLPSVQ